MAKPTVKSSPLLNFLAPQYVTCPIKKYSLFVFFLIWLSSYAIEILKGYLTIQISNIFLVEQLRTNNILENIKRIEKNDKNNECYCLCKCAHCLNIISVHIRNGPWEKKKFNRNCSCFLVFFLFVSEP